MTDPPREPSDAASDGFDWRGYEWKLDESGRYRMPDIELISPDGSVAASVDAKDTNGWFGWHVWNNDPAFNSIIRHSFEPTVEAAKAAAMRAYAEWKKGERDDFAR